MFWSVQSNRHLQSLPGKINPTFKFKKLIYIYIYQGKQGILHFYASMLCLHFSGECSNYPAIH